MAYTDDEVTQRLQEEAAKRGVTFDPSDVEDVRHRDNTPEAIAMALRKYDTRATNTPNQGGGGNQSPAQAWNTQPQQAPQSMFPDWYKELMTRDLGLREQQQAENKSRADSLYSTLDTRAKQGLNVNAQDPIISGQVDAFRAEQERARRNYISDEAERQGPYANLRGERRMGAEQVGQATSGFQAELLGRELSARRDEIAQALSTQGALLSGDQNRALQQQLAAYDQAIKEAGVGLQGRSLDLQGELGRGDLALRGELGRGGLALQGRGLDQSNDEFLRELSLRQWDLGNQNEFRWATL